MAAINENYSLSSMVGPGGLDSNVTVSIRLKQIVNDHLVYTTLMEPSTYPASTVVPVNFTNIEGAFGVENGEVEVINSDTGAVLATYPLKFAESQ